MGVVVIGLVRVRDAGACMAMSTVLVFMGDAGRTSAL